MKKLGLATNIGSTTVKEPTAFADRERGIQFINMNAMLGQNLYVVNIEDGENAPIKKAVIQKAYYQSAKGVVTKRFYIQDRANLFYVLAKNKEEASVKYEAMFSDMDKKLKQRNSLTE